MLNEIKQLFKGKELLKGHFGIERESLRCDSYGNLATTPHPEVFGAKLFNPYITTDFSESQVELITPAFETIEETHKFLCALYDITALELGDEYLWPQSMPCNIPDDQQIPLAEFCKCPSGEKAYAYRRKLLAKYGGKRQLVSGIHYNFSFNEDFIRKLYEHGPKDKSYREFRDYLYLKVARNYLRYRWLLIYLLGSSSVMHESYVEECVKQLQEVAEDSYTNDGALSYRNSEYGYTNKVELFPNYQTIEDYTKSLEKFVTDGLIESPKELYSQIRLKAYDNESLLESLQEEGIAYLEYRSIDINPFEKSGIKLDDLYFMHLFNLFLLLEEESDYTKWQQEALKNQRCIAKYGQKENLLLREGKLVSKEEWGIEILERMQEINYVLELGQEEVLNEMIKKVEDYTLTYAHQIVEMVKEKGYLKASIELARNYKNDAYQKRFKFEGYEDMELSTQILMKEAVKRGIKIEILDREENFIALKKRNHVEYIKQATKTGADNYITALMMENKIVTKKLLKQKGIRVPEGESFSHIDEAKDKIDLYINKPIVIKPKSTNFGIGISIFPTGASKEDLQKALEIAFSHDDAVLVERFIPGKEYRFLVINDEAVGILHRVPANVIGNGTHTIRELVEIKNQNVLRGKGYKTPLEKIQLDESAKLFLKQQNKDFETVPLLEEVVFLRENSNISTGGDSIDYTDQVHEYFKKIAVASAKAVGAKICGVDMMLENIEDVKASYGIIELNFNPAIHIHSFPYKGKERNVAVLILKLLGFE
ncbi:bifunctional glutamate--cysteine ligase GshA/glutathione synthetase GshB [Niameybacter massiliensis]|uniref:Glutathione biosynthesis bifunctional protein GshAB n=1 Tax=Holtiella tumoricola TaxID=3018743 RepID=A0AA42DLS0_9FIRM|nr:bifunctional glutamate--cysteine ligase GshA/glutathione synthetase GshB [Holtiella tumoricola]MDA3731229.1 bifunctional glutamate--cysteine ligase GshA/glutathione synthetase GshB [Holtiella tumoricola]